ncbi:MAG: pyrroline-5-carboxylate reductase [Candidatus Omnitrophota bacterium]|nr:pyrroline-5-carboxylate reductase [Candidatus Omnitrophota bacterium]
MKEAIGIIGFGNMGSVIAQRLKKKYKIVVFDKDKGKTRPLIRIKAADSLLELVRNTNVLILAVKPQEIDEVLSGIRGSQGGKLVISIAAGIPISYIEKRLVNAAVVRVMPNLAICVSKGMSCLCKGRHTAKLELDFAQKLFDNLGLTLKIKEGLMNAVTAISGSAPGYLYKLLQSKKKIEWMEYSKNDFLPKLFSAAQSLGFTVSQAKVLAETTVLGSLALLRQSGLSPKKLCLKVASKGGTTEAGLNILDKGGSLEEAAKAALKRANEIEKLFPTQSGNCFQPKAETVSNPIGKLGRGR